MISLVELSWFKCFKYLQLPLGALTLLTGRNASGKSSILQALALLQQTMREHEWSTHLALNGDTIQLGTLSDVIDDIHGRTKFRIGLIDEDRKYRWEFAGNREDMSGQVDKVTIDGNLTSSPRLLRYLLPVHGQSQVKAGQKHAGFPLTRLPPVPSLANRLRRLSYLTAERAAPRDFYSLEDPKTSNIMAPQGENAVSILYRKRSDKVLAGLRLEGPPTLLQQVQCRMQQIFPGLTIDLKPVRNVNAVTLGFRTFSASGFHRPLHTGFGLIQVLPVIVAALTAPKQDILLIENPEIHLHPEGQALMGELLAEVASAGVQTIVETHSDHILNGIRRAVKAGKLKAEETAVYFFRLRDEKGPQVLRPVLDSKGNIDTWPDGFFDQFDKDLNFFVEWDS